MEIALPSSRVPIIVGPFFRKLQELENAFPDSLQCVPIHWFSLPRRSRTRQTKGTIPQTITPHSSARPPKCHCQRLDRPEIPLAGQRKSTAWGLVRTICGCTLWFPLWQRQKFQTDSAGFRETLSLSIWSDLGSRPSPRPQREAPTVFTGPRPPPPS